MGVLTARLHGSITAIAAFATASASTEMPDMSRLKDFSRLVCFASQSTILSSLQAGCFSSFDAFVSPAETLVVNASAPSINALAAIGTRVSSTTLSRSASMIPTRPGHQSAAITSTPTSSSLVAIQSASLDSYRVASAPGATTSLSPSDFGCTSCNLPARLSFNSFPFLPRSFCLNSESQVYNSFSLCNSYLRPSTLAKLQQRKPGCNNRLHSPYYRYAHPLTSSKPFPLCRVPSFPRLFQASQFGNFTSSLHSSPVFPSVSVKLLHSWHSPDASYISSQQCDGGEGDPGKEKATVVVVLLGWLGAQQKHLRRYADWYNSRGIHAVTFVVPMWDLVSLKAGDKAEKHIDMLADQLTLWLTEDNKEGEEKFILFHTFSNTGWLTYGGILERFMQGGHSLLKNIKGCVVDSAPSAKPDPRVWASGFSSALLKKRSALTQNLGRLGGALGTTHPEDKLVTQVRPDFTETALLAMLEKFFSVFLQLPYVNRRLTDVISVLSKQQPPCPQLYIYSTADTVIPVKSVESFIEEQRLAGQSIRACDFQWSPHVDHFRTFPDLYSDQLSSFLKLCVPQLPGQ